ncbi:MAG: serine hydrolase [Acidobacteria bacterium]|nr:serine hydrolase [Acidobacteriota bacterium]MBI3662638.1 serine hydrolase [Acidobacteriota bacterium]
MKRPAALLSLVILLLAAPAFAQTPQPNPLAGDLKLKLAKQLQQIAAEFDGVMGIAVKDLGTGETFFANADTVFPQASSIKIPILLELFRQAQAGALKLDERVDVKKAHMTAGSGVLLHFSDGGSALSLRDLAVLMIVLSDNTATNILIDRVGMQSVNDNLRRLGLTQTRLQRIMLDVEAQRASRENLSTPREMVALLELLDAGKTLDPKHTQAALEILKYPKNTALRRGLPANVALASKPGGISGVACESGIVYLAGKPYAISVMTTFDKDSDVAEDAIIEVSRRVYTYFERLARSNSLGARLP